MHIFVEDPEMVVSGVETGGSKRVCPHGFEPIISCRCFFRPGIDPGDAGCHGREFSEHSVDAIIPLHEPLKAH